MTAAYVLCAWARAGGFRKPVKKALRGFSLAGGTVKPLICQHHADGPVRAGVGTQQRPNSGSQVGESGLLLTGSHCSALASFMVSTQGGDDIRLAEVRSHRRMDVRGMQ